MSSWSYKLQRLQRWVRDYRPWESRISRMKRYFKRLERGEKRAIAKAKDYREKDLIRQSFGYDMYCVEQGISAELTKSLLKRCRKNDIPIPPQNDLGGYWRYAEEEEEWVLTPNGRHHLDKLLHEKATRSIGWMGHWGTLLGGVGAIAAAIIAYMDMSN